jgi:hypothetical protein
MEVTKMSEKKFYQKSWVVWGLLFLIMFTSAFYIIEKIKTGEIIAKEEAKKEQEEKNRQEVKDFIDQMLSEDTNYRTYTNTYLARLKENDIKGAYDAATKAHSEAKRLESLYSTYNAPKGAPEYALTLFESASSKLSVAYSVRAEAYAFVLEYLDTQNPSDLNNAKSKFTESDGYYLSGTDTLKSIQTQMGIRVNNKK